MVAFAIVAGFSPGQSVIDGRFARRLEPWRIPSITVTPVPRLPLVCGCIAQRRVHPTFARCERMLYKQPSHNPEISSEGGQGVDVPRLWAARLISQCSTCMKLEPFPSLR
ncbi:hypothetical protein BDN72DRAFT_650057 [Pluteus cervinus]|uniref:Uncharacterized protein n=1 Tax=Pluteus cervinus TaxID=181527 RepID=A0ACD3A0Q2_9AGAR|nr:hypothetical protein BDN72DRAFT_650057 [Pluteus cervinus]